MRYTFITALLSGCVAVAAPVLAVPVDFTASGANPAAIQTTVDNFRNALGALNAFDPVNNADGRRQINWDAAPGVVSDPNPFPGDFFNANFNPRARGITFTTPGTGFLLSSDPADAGTGQPAPPLFGGAASFQTFSPNRLFTPIGSPIVDVFFQNPALPQQGATSDGFGAVFTDVELDGLTKLEFFDRQDVLIHTLDVPVGGNQSLSFAGAVFDKPVVARVRITAGDVAILGNGSQGTTGSDAVVMDDFIFGEPQPVPVPGALVLLAGGLGLMGLIARRRR